MYYRCDGQPVQTFGAQPQMGGFGYGGFAPVQPVMYAPCCGYGGGDSCCWAIIIIVFILIFCFCCGGKRGGVWDNDGCCC